MGDSEYDPKFPTNAEGMQRGRASLSLLAREEGVVSMLLTGQGATRGIGMHGLREGTHYTQRGSGIGNAVGEGLADTVKAAVADAVAITNLSSEGVRKKWIFLELGARVYTGGAGAIREG